MFRRKLAALNHPRCNEIDPKNDSEFRNLIVWLEDQKIRHYKIEDRAGLRNISSEQWLDSLSSYLKSLECPFPPSDRSAVTDWLLGHAVRVEFGDNVEKYQDVTAKKKPDQQKSSLNSIQATDQDFKDGVRKLAKLLQVPLHEDDQVTLEAVKILLNERFVQKKNTDTTEKLTNIPLDQLDLGFDLGDPQLNKAACALRLLHINELRQLQTDINDAVVQVQTLTANPKTNQSLGKVGYS